MEAKEKKSLLNLVIAIFLFNSFALILYFLRKEPSLSNYVIILNNIFFTLVILIAAFFISKIINILINKRLKSKKGIEKTPQLFNRLITLIVFILALIVILQYFQVKITPMLAALGIAGLAIGLALQSTLSNLFAGLQILGNKPIRVGDYIEVNNFEGYVEDIGWRSVRMKTIQNNLIIIPNSKLMESVIINDSMPEKQMSVLVQCGVDYSSDLKHVEKITLDIARKIQKTFDGAVSDFEPLIRYHTFGDNNIDFTVVLRIKEFSKKYPIKHEFIKALKEKYDKEGIEISWPIRKVTDMDKKK